MYDSNIDKFVCNEFNFVMALLPLKDENKIINIKFQYVTLIIIISCVTAFLWQVSLGVEQNKIIYALGTIPTVLFGTKELAPNLTILPESLTIFTNLFLHGGWMHLIFNMLFLWVFGDNIEDSMGHLRFILFYFICGVLATITHATIESNSNVPLIGASGAISGVLGAYLILHPKARVLVLFMNIIPLRLPAIVVLGFWIGIQFFNLNSENGIAWWAHIGGFTAGMVLIIPFKKKKFALHNPWKSLNAARTRASSSRVLKRSTSIFPNSLSKNYFKDNRKR